MTSAFRLVPPARWMPFAMIACLAVGALGTGGCASRIERVATEESLTTGDIDIQDWENAASALSESLLNSGILGRGGEPDVLVISDYRNATSRKVDKDRLLRKVRISLNRAGVAQTSTVEGLGPAEDTYAAQRQEVEEFLGSPQARPTPDYSVTVKLLEDRSRAGRDRQVAYSFQMTLTDLRTGLAVWEDEETIVKQGSRGAVGW